MATITTNTADYGWRPDEVTFAPVDSVPTALILRTTAVGDAVDIDGDEPSLHVAFVNDAESAEYVDEADTIDEDNPDLDEVLVKTKKISRLVKLSNEQFRKSQTASQISASVARDLVRKADNSYLGDDGTGDKPLGLLHAEGVVDGALIEGNLDPLIDLLAQLEQNGAEPSAIVTDPITWAELRKLKVGGEHTNESLLGAGTTDATPMLLSLPLLRSRFVPSHSGLVIDRNAIAAAVGPVRVAQSEHAAFTADSMVVRATWRIGWNLVRPERIGRFSFLTGS